MSTPRWTCFAAILLISVQAVYAAKGPGLGQPAAPEDVGAWDISIPPSGRGLPAGSGSPQRGETVYNQHCANCHGAKGIGKPNDRLVGGQGTLVGTQPPIKTVGSYWPYATTIFDYVRRSMPLNAPQSLSDDDVYAVTAYLLYLNGILTEGVVVDAHSLPRVRMPNRDSFKNLYLNPSRPGSRTR
jgi:cytochrome c